MLRARVISGIAAFATVASVALSGCTGSSDPGKPSASGATSVPAPGSSTAPRSSSAPVSVSTTARPSSSHRATPTVPADVPKTGPNVRPGERPPVEPVLATKHTDAGAKAFAKFFIRTIDWGFATTSGAYMRHYFQHSCVECRSHADGLDNTRKAGGHYIGDRFSLRAADITDSRAYGSDAAVLVTFDITSMEAVDAKGNFKNAEPAHKGDQRELWLAWKEGAWIVVYMAPPASLRGSTA